MPKKKEKKKKEKELGFTPDQAKAIMSWWGRLSRSPEKMREVKECIALKDVERTKATKELGLLEEFSFDRDTITKLVFVLARIKEHEKGSFRKRIKEMKLTETRRSSLSQGICEDIVSVLDLNHQKANVIDVAKIVINWELVKQNIF